MKIFGIVGTSGSGKTTLLEKLIPAICAHGITVSTIKHTHHHFDIDKPGKDSFRQREAGAKEVMLASSKRWALLHELREDDEPEIEELVTHMSDVDLLLVEGFKRHPHPKIEVFRPDHGRECLWANDDHVIGVASDDIIDTDGLPLLELDDVEEICDFIIGYLELEKKS